MKCQTCGRKFPYEGFETCLPCYVKSVDVGIEYATKTATLLPQPTEYPPGSIGKIKAMAERVRLGQKLFHPEDACIPSCTRGRLVKQYAQQAS